MTRKMAIQMHCNLRPPDVAPVVIRFNYMAHTELKSNLSVPDL